MQFAKIGAEIIHVSRIIRMGTNALPNGGRNIYIEYAANDYTGNVIGSVFNLDHPDYEAVCRFYDFIALRGDTIDFSEPPLCRFWRKEGHPQESQMVWIPQLARWQCLWCDEEEAYKRNKFGNYEDVPF